MSHQPEPPASIAKALLSVFSGNDIVDDECITEQARAVWDALVERYPAIVELVKEADDA